LKTTKPDFIAIDLDKKMEDDINTELQNEEDDELINMIRKQN
jgi:hypothetical protein